jgi:hypothetical protein
MAYLSSAGLESDVVHHSGCFSFRCCRGGPLTLGSRLSDPGSSAIGIPHRGPSGMGLWPQYCRSLIAKNAALVLAALLTVASVQRDYLASRACLGFPLS